LAVLAGTTVRTIHYYTAEGLLPPPEGATRNATYSAAHLARLRLIAALREEGLSLAAIRTRLAPLTDAQVLDVIDALDQHLGSAPPATISTLGLIEAAVAAHAAPEAQPEAAPPAHMPAPAIVRYERRISEGGQAELRLPLAPPSSVQARHGEPSGTAREYLDRLLHREPPTPTSPVQPAPQPPPQPRPLPLARKPQPPTRPEAWYHFQIDDGVELRVREDRYHQAKGRLSAVTEAVRHALQRYGLVRDEPDKDGHQPED